MPLLPTAAIRLDADSRRQASAPLWCRRRFRRSSRHRADRAGQRIRFLRRHLPVAAGIPDCPQQRLQFLDRHSGALHPLPQGLHLAVEGSSLRRLHLFGEHPVDFILHRSEHHFEHHPRTARPGDGATDEQDDQCDDGGRSAPERDPSRKQASLRRRGRGIVIARPARRREGGQKSRRTLDRLGFRGDGLIQSILKKTTESGRVNVSCRLKSHPITWRKSLECRSRYRRSRS